MSWNTEVEHKYINSILSLSYIKDLMNTGKVMCIRLDGSRAADLEDEKSDYDITIMMDCPAFNSDKEIYLRYNIEGRKTHFYLQGHNWFNHNYRDFTSQYVMNIGGLLSYANFNFNTVLYLNPIYQKHLVNILDHKELFYTQGIYEVFKNRDLILELYPTKEYIRKQLYIFFQALDALGLPKKLIPAKSKLQKYKNKEADTGIQDEQLKYFQQALKFLDGTKIIKDHGTQLQELVNHL